MPTKVNADHLQKLSTTHKNVSVSVKAKATKAQATTTKLRLDSSRNPAVKAVPARAQAVAQRVTVKSTTIDTRSTELAKRADYVREQAAKASAVKTPTKVLAMPVTTRSASQASSSAAKLSIATKARPKPPDVKPQLRRSTFLRPVPTPKTKEEKPVIKQQFKRNDIVQNVRRVEWLKGAGGQVRRYNSRATNAKVGGTILRTAVTTTTTKTNKTGPHDNPIKKVETRSDSVVFYSDQKFVGATGTVGTARTVEITGPLGTTQVRGGVQLQGAAGAYKSKVLSLKREGGKTELNANANIGVTARTTVTAGVLIGTGPLALQQAAKGTVMIGANGGAEGAVSYSSRQASIKAKAAVFAGVGAEGEGSFEIVPGVKIIGGAGASLGIGANAQGELTATPTRLKIGGGVGATFGPGGKVNVGVEVNLPRVAAAATATVQAARATPIVRAIESRARPVIRAVEAQAKPVIRAVAATYNHGVQRVQAVVSVARKTPVGQAVTRAYTSGVTAVRNGFVAVQKSPVGKTVASTYKSVTKAWNGFWGQ